MESKGFVLQATAMVGHGDRVVRARAFFAYVAADPYALRMGIETRSGLVRWEFARDLLADGLNRATGAGDVVIAPVGDDQVWITLSSPSGEARLRFPRAQMQRLLELSAQLVSLGTESEHINWDQALAALAEGGER